MILAILAAFTFWPTFNSLDLRGKFQNRELRRAYRHKHNEVIKHYKSISIVAE